MTKQEWWLKCCDVVFGQQVTTKLNYITYILGPWLFVFILVITMSLSFLATSRVAHIYRIYASTTWKHNTICFITVTCNLYTKNDNSMLPNKNNWPILLVQ